MELDVAGPGVARVPDAPASGLDDVGHGRVLDGDAGVLAPWAAEIVGASGDGVAARRGDVALVEDVPVGVAGAGAAGSGDVALGGLEDADVARGEPGGSMLAEDEVGGTLDQGLGVQLVAGLCEDGVLEAEELAGVVALVLGRG